MIETVYDPDTGVIIWKRGKKKKRKKKAIKHENS